MEQRRFSRKEYEDAMELLRQRIDNEQSMTVDVERILDEYAGYILYALSRGASEEDIELLIDDLVTRIMDDCRMLAVDEHDVDDDVLALVFDDEDMPVEGRVRKRAETFLDEVTAFFSAGEILHMDDASILAAFRDSMDDPWDNEVINEVRGMIERGEVSGDAEYYEERHYGKGVPVSSKVDIEFITVSAIASTWNEWSWRSASAEGARGYYVERGSSYPCDECESHTGIFYPITDHDHLPQYHRNCRCFAVYVHDEDIIANNS